MESNLISKDYIDGQQQTGVSRLSTAGYISVIAIVLLSNLLFGAVSSGALALISLILVLTVIFWVSEALFTKQLGYSNSHLQLPLIGLILIGLIQLLPFAGSSVSPDLLAIPTASSFSIIPFATSFAVLKLVLFLLFFAAALVYVDSPERTRLIVFILIIYAAFMSFLGILQKLSNPGFVLWIRQVDYATPFATFVNQHHFASFLVMTTALTLGLLFAGSTKPDKRLLLIIAAIMMGLGIVFSSSRGAMISLVAVLALLSGLSFWSGQKSGSKSHQRTYLKRVWVLVGANVALVVFLLISVAWIGGSDIALRSTGLDSAAEFSNGRLDFWANTLRIARDNPVLGTGLDTFDVAYTRYDNWNGQLRVNQAHNEYLQILSEAGILGLACVVAFIFLLFRQSLRIIGSSIHPFRKGVAAGALAGCFGIMVHSFFDFPLRTNANMFCFLLFAVLATAPIEFPVVIRKRKKIEE